MKTLLLAGAGALLFAASAAQAAPTELQRFQNQAETQAQTALRAAGVDLKGQPVKVRAMVGSEGHIYRAQVIGSTGSHDTDVAVEAAVKKVVVGDAPALLSGNSVVLTLGAGSGGQAVGR